MGSLPRTTALIAALMMLLVQTSATARTPVEQDFFADPQLILNASRKYEPRLESPASVCVITRQTSESSGVRQPACPGAAHCFGDQYRIGLIGQHRTEEFDESETENIHFQVVYLRFIGGF